MAFNRELKEIFELAANGGLMRDDMQSLLSQDDSKEAEVIKQKKKRSITTGLALFVAFIAIIWGIVFGMKSPYVIKEDLLGMAEESACFVDHTQASLEMVRPPSNCTAMCAGLKEVERLPSITQEEFISKYAYSGRPLIVTEATKNWTAFNTFSYDFFKKIYRKHKEAMDLNGAGCQFFPYKTNMRGLKDVFRMSKKKAELKGKTWYIGWYVAFLRYRPPVSKQPAAAE